MELTVQLKIDISINLQLKKGDKEILTTERRTFASGPILH
jgi:hypothetical protein